jgi:hypothetical protein
MPVDVRLTTNQSSNSKRGRRIHASPVFFTTEENVKQQKLRSLLIIAIVAFAAALAVTPDTALAGRQRSVGRLDEISGVIIKASSQWLTVRTAKSGDREVRLTASTQVTVGDHQVSASTIRLGDKVEMHVRKESDNTFTAVSIALEDHQSGKEIQGIVRAVSANSITIKTLKDEVVVAVTVDTKFLINDKAASVAEVTPGALVEVETTLGADDKLVALVVKIESETVEIEGVVTAISPTSMTVRKRDGSTVDVALTKATIVRSGGKLTGPASIILGSQVAVEAVKNADGKLTALLVETRSQNELTKIKGVVTSVGTNQLKVKTPSGDELTVMVTADTVIRMDDHVVPLSSVHTGDHVDIEAMPGADSKTFTAVRIEVDQDDHLVEVNGTIKEIKGSAITILTEHGDSITVTIGASTKIRRGDTPVPPSQLHTGDHVSAKAQRNADGTLSAVDINLLGDRNDEHGANDVHGVVTAITTSSVTVKTEKETSVTLTITKDTVVVKDGKPATIADVKVNAHVKIKAAMNKDGSLTALVIKIENDDNDEHED